MLITLSLAVCGGSLSGVNGSFNYRSPDVGPVRDVTCFWVIRTEEGKVNVGSSVQIYINLNEHVICVGMTQNTYNGNSAIILRYYKVSSFGIDILCAFL